jgi:Lar family restriction alleviation protein
MKIELKPCPFCGGKAEMKGVVVAYVKCSNCKAETGCYEKEDEAAGAWNRRVGGNNVDT